MPRKWKQQAVMFAFVMIATIFAMKNTNDCEDSLEGASLGEKLNGENNFFTDSMKPFDSAGYDQNDDEIHAKKEIENRITGIQIGKTPVKKHNFFAYFLEGADLVKYTLLHPNHTNFIELPFESIPLEPVNLKFDDGNAAIYWNPNTRTIVSVNVGFKDFSRGIYTKNIFETEKCKLVSGVFSKIRDTESPTAYVFYFDTTEGCRNWFIIGLHKRESKCIGRQWSYISKDTFKITDFEPCDFQNRWITKSSTDGISRTLLAKGYDFLRDQRPTPNDSTQKNQDEKENHEKFGDLSNPQNGWNVDHGCKTRCLSLSRYCNNYRQKLCEAELSKHLVRIADNPALWGQSIYRTDVKDVEKLKKEQYQYNLEYALRQKWDTSAKFLLSSYKSANMKGKVPSRTHFHLDQLATDQESLETWSSVFSDEDVITAYRSNLCKSFTNMMESKKWPEKLWFYALQSENECSHEMMKLLFERMKKLPAHEQLNILFKANDEGNMVLFDKTMSLAGNESTEKGEKDQKWTKYIKSCDSLINVFHKDVQTKVYTGLLLFGVVKNDLDQCKFAVRNRASLQEKTSTQLADAVAYKHCKHCERKRSRVNVEVLEENANDMSDCLRFKLKDKTSLEVARVLPKNKSIKTFLERVKNPASTKETAVSILDSDEDSKIKRKRNMK